MKKINILIFCLIFLSVSNLVYNTNVSTKNTNVDKTYKKSVWEKKNPPEGGIENVYPSIENIEKKDKKIKLWFNELQDVDYYIIQYSPNMDYSVARTKKIKTERKESNKIGTRYCKLDLGTSGVIYYVKIRAVVNTKPKKSKKIKKLKSAWEKISI